MRKKIKKKTNKGVKSSKDLTNPLIDLESISGRIFSYDQLSKISDENHEVLNRNLNVTYFDKDETFELRPMMIHEHAYGEKVIPHYRTRVIPNKHSKLPAFQDLTFDQFERGKLVSMDNTMVRQ
jgi:hypothetical protein